MLAIAKREILSFFTTPLGYSILAVFFILNGLLLWVFANAFNLVDSGFADLNLYFELMPWLFLFLVPAIGMKAFSEEIKSGTIALLFTKPISIWELILGKFLGMLFLISCSLFTSFIYAYVIIELKFEQDVFDWGAFWGSFLGLFFLAALFSSITLWCSCFSKNQVVAFLAAVLLCFLHFYGWGEASLYFSDNTVYSFFNTVGISSHFNQMSKGLIDSKDLIYVAGQLVLVLFLAVNQLQKLKR
jgi:ABC-2 type transport system permease protein